MPPVAISIICAESMKTLASAARRGRRRTRRIPARPEVSGMTEERHPKQLLDELHRLGVRLHLDGDRLDVMAPAGALTPQPRAEPTRRRDHVVALLRATERRHDASPTSVPHSFIVAHTSGDPHIIESTIDTVRKRAFNNHNIREPPCSHEQSRRSPRRFT
jgi:hypothetical protein